MILPPILAAYLQIFQITDIYRTLKQIDAYFGAAGLIIFVVD
jgi:hypothetical protein